MKKVIAVLLMLVAAALLWQCSGESNASLSSDMKAQLALMPDDTKGLAYMNLDKIRQSPFYEMALDSMEDRIDNDEEFQELVDATGFDLRRDVSEIFVTFEPDPRERGGAVLAVVKGTFDPEKIMAYVEEKDQEDNIKSEKHGEFTIYRGEHERSDMVLCFASETRAVGGKEDLVKSWLDNFKAGKSSVSSDMMARIENVKYKNGAWFVIDTENIMDEVMNSVNRQADMRQFGALRKVKNVQMSVNVNDAIKMNGTGDFSDAENAELFHDAIKGALATLKLSMSHDREAVDVVNKVNLSTDKQHVKLDVEMTKQDIEKLMQRGRGFAMR